MVGVSLIENISEKERKIEGHTLYPRNRVTFIAMGHLVNALIYVHKTYSPPRKDPLPDIAELP